jgi:mRNA interferase MazF
MRYVPDKGHWVWLRFDPQAGHEQAGRRPGLVLSPLEFNRASGFCFVAPVTNTRRGLRTHIAISTGQAVTRFVLADHTKSLDFRARDVEYIDNAPADLVQEVIDVVVSILDNE